MNAPRWTLDPTNGRTLIDNGAPVFFLSVAVGNQLTNDSMRMYARRIVSLLNATEIAPDALVTVQRLALQSGDDELADTLGAAARMYVEMNTQ